MKNVKRFGNFTYDNIIENVNVNKYQRTIQKFYKNSNVELHNAATFSTSIIVLVQVVQLLLEYGTFNIEPTINNAVAITIFAISVLTNDSKDKVEKLYKYLQDMKIEDDDINKVINQLRNFQAIFKFIVKDTEQKIESFNDMLERTGLLVPFISIINNQIKNNLLNPDLLIGTIKEFQDTLGDLKFKVFLNKILRKLDIITKATNKFQNKDNAKPLRVNDEFKSPAFKTTDTILEESIRDYMKPKDEADIKDIISKEMNGFLGKCYNYILQNCENCIITSEPGIWKPEDDGYTNMGDVIAFKFELKNTKNENKFAFAFDKDYKKYVLYGLWGEDYIIREPNPFNNFKKIMDTLNNTGDWNNINLTKESLRDKMLPKSDEEIDKIIPLKSKELIDQCFNFIINETTLKVIKEPDFYITGDKRYSFAFGYWAHTYLLQYSDNNKKILLVEQGTNDKQPINSLEEFKDIVMNKIIIK